MRSNPVIGDYSIDAVDEMKHLFEIMARWRDPVTGCPWDKELNFQANQPLALMPQYRKPCQSVLPR